ncbi:hypothetical protein Hanom_Chr12g01064911 [Helianthus anomalus]
MNEHEQRFRLLVCVRERSIICLLLHSCSFVYVKLLKILMFFFYILISLLSFTFPLNIG